MWDPVESRPVNVLIVGARADEMVLLGDAIAGLDYSIRCKSIASCRSVVGFLTRDGSDADWPPPDLIMLFCDRRDPDPIDVLPQIRTLPGLEITPILFFASAQSQARIKRAYALGANCVVYKSPSAQEFEKACRGALDFWLSCAELPGH